MDNISLVDSKPCIQWTIRIHLALVVIGWRDRLRQHRIGHSSQQSSHVFLTVSTPALLPRP